MTQEENSFLLLCSVGLDWCCDSVGLDWCCDTRKTVDVVTQEENSFLLDNSVGSD